MSFAEHYFTHHTFLMPQIKEPPPGLLSFIVVIPSYMEDHLIETLECLKNTRRPTETVEVIIVFNYSEKSSDEEKNFNKYHYNLTKEWSAKNSEPSMVFFPVLAGDLPARHAGAGLARKIGMDEALHRYNLLNKPDGIILSLDADTLVEDNYFTAIEKAFLENVRAGGCLIPFCHSLEGEGFDHNVYRAIGQYELHMRYYKHQLENIGFPFAYYTVGSCFGVKANVYARSGGMSRNKAGEDFYFLNKLFPHYNFVEVQGTKVYPSPRPSLRVPFGTGATVTQLLKEPGQDYLTYHPESFLELKQLLDIIPRFYSFNQKNADQLLHRLPLCLQQFISQQDFPDKIMEIAGNTSTAKAFIKRFFLWFDGFRIVKFLNYAHDCYYKKIPVNKAASDFLKYQGLHVASDDVLELLRIFRRLDHVTE